MPKIRLTHRGIGTLSATKWMTDYWDEQLPGFGVRVSPSGRKTYGIRYTKKDGQKKRKVIGVYPIMSLADARDKARERLYEVVREETSERGEEMDLCFAELVDTYLEKHAKVKKRTWREDQRIFEVDILPLWENHIVSDIRRTDVVELLDAIVDRGAPIMANRTKALISKVFNFGIGRGLVEHNPCFGVPNPGKARQRDRVLTENEIRRIWQTLEEEGTVVASHFQMRLLTAQRGNEVLRMRWNQIDGDWWTIPAEVAKNGLAHGVPLSGSVQALLDRLRHQTGGSSWVFASPRVPETPINAVQKAASRMAHRSGVDFVPHDLRRTAATFMTSMGTPRLVVSKILNHVEQGVTAIYDRHSYDQEKREALDRWGRKVEEVISGSRC